MFCSAALTVGVARCQSGREALGLFEGIRLGLSPTPSLDVPVSDLAEKDRRQDLVVVVFVLPSCSVFHSGGDVGSAMPFSVHIRTDVSNPQRC